ncbi:zinc finger protein 701-like [Camelus ferus]|uniref:Zinc finger protein 701-like n=1 Tax=Camelus ferus TaxID=419612 RepID=A0A8B8TNA7_CAMFR|nr:zinc finger protein 701-like [Camelus ferus]
MPSVEPVESLQQELRVLSFHPGGPLTSRISDYLCDWYQTPTPFLRNSGHLFPAPHVGSRGPLSGDWPGLAACRRKTTLPRILCRERSGKHCKETEATSAPCRTLGRRGRFTGAHGTVSVAASLGSAPHREFENTALALMEPTLASMTFKDVAVPFNQDEWGQLDTAQRTLYWEVLLETCGLLASLEGKEELKNIDVTTDEHKDTGC